MFNLATGEENTYQCHESVINNLQPGRNNLVITSTTWRLPYSKIWKIGEFFEEKMTFKDEEHLEFSKLIQDKVVGTCAEGVATIWDLNTSQLVRTLTPVSSDQSEACNLACDQSEVCIYVKLLVHLFLLWFITVQVLFTVSSAGPKWPISVFIKLKWAFLCAVQTNGL